MDIGSLIANVALELVGITLMVNVSTKDPILIASPIIVPPSKITP
jgi:hypothetical protein